MEKKLTQIPSLEEIMLELESPILLVKFNKTFKFKTNNLEDASSLLIRIHRNKENVPEWVFPAIEPVFLRFVESVLIFISNIEENSIDELKKISKLLIEYKGNQDLIGKSFKLVTNYIDLLILSSFIKKNQSYSKSETDRQINEFLTKLDNFHECNISKLNAEVQSEI